MYTTTADYIREVVAPALGDLADDYDLTAIAHDMLTRVTTTTLDGSIDADHSGYTECDDIDSWAVVARHDTTH